MPNDCGPRFRPESDTWIVGEILSEEIHSGYLVSALQLVSKRWAKEK